MPPFFSPGTPQAAVPGDLKGFRSQQIALLQQLLGLSPTQGGGAPPSSGPNSIIGSIGRRGGTQQSSVPTGPLGADSDPLARLQAFFGQLGSPQTDLQRQSTGGISQFLNQPAPEQRALEIAMPGLQEILSGGGPQFERDLALANQSGGRFGSANAILRGEAHRNLLNQRNQAAQTLGLLSQSAGQNPFQRLLGAFGAGGAQAGQNDLETQRRLQILLNLLGVAQQTAFNHPTTQAPSPFSQLLGAAAPIAGFALGGPAGAAAGGALTR